MLGLPHGSQRRFYILSQRQIIETHKRNVVRNLEPVSADRLERPDSGPVVVTEDRRGWFGTLQKVGHGLDSPLGPAVAMDDQLRLEGDVSFPKRGSVSAVSL